MRHVGRVVTHDQSISRAANIRGARQPLASEANAERGREKLTIGFLRRRSGAATLRFDGRTPDVVITELREDGAEVHAAAEVHAEVGGAALADDLVDGYEPSRIADVPPGIAITRDVSDRRRRDLNRTVVHAHADQTVWPHMTVGCLEDDVRGPILHVHAAEEVRGNRSVARINADGNGDSFLSKTVEAVKTFNADHRRHVHLHTEVEVIAVAQMIFDIRVRDGEAATD